ncbi:putative serine/threonine protein kinase [Streptomyces lincolnensis]|uniref:serine/threonine-protein kinase n=1 Tax=Streptomyces lincolnensis TaxID=1915 RepID=UPI00082D7461|nr:serine/threonine-protein kinase [Streptomyces lincolnensis]AXG58875.1 putative serine/threonine protein kinase [Streptomyces lincolnensis]
MSERVISGDGDHQATGSGRGAERLIAGRYQLHEVLGRGGMGTVWRAHDRLLDRPVAAKELHILGSGDEERRTRLRRATREARAVARVPHPHVVGVHDLVESEDRLWIVMELVEGPSLAHRVSESGPLTPQRAAAVGLQLLDALEAVHAVGALHRDVKPANVLLRRDGNAVLTDFGIAALDDGDFLTTTGELVGSLEFMAPERVTGADAGPASDLWSLGVTLATVCGGRSPFRRPAGPATLHAVAYEEPVLPERLGPLRPVVEALLRKSPRDRPSAAAVRTELGRVAAGRAGAEPLPPETVRVSPAPLADADTVTRDRRSIAAGGEPVPTAWSTTSLSRRRSSRRAGPKRLWWALSGTAVLAAGVAGGLFLSGVLPIEEDPRTTTVSEVVQSATGWQPVTAVSVQRGDQVRVRFVSGEWTADHRNMPMTASAGYDRETDRRLEGAKGCKVKPAAPFGALLAVLAGVKNAPVHTVGRELTFRAAGNGTLQLGMNDIAGFCSQDNRGELAVRVSVTHRS